MSEVSFAFKLIAPCEVTVCVPLLAEMEAEIVLSITLFEPAPAAAAATAPPAATEAATAPPMDSALIVASDVALRLTAPAALALDPVMLASTVLAIRLLATATPRDAPALPPPLTAKLMPTPPALAVMTDVSLAVSVMPPLVSVSTSAPLSRRARALLVMVLPEPAPAAPTDAPPPPPPLAESAPPMVSAAIVASSVAVSVMSLPVDLTVEPSMVASTVLVIRLVAAERPADTAAPPKPPPTTAAATPPASALMVDSSTALSVTPLMARTPLVSPRLLLTYAVTVLVITLPEPAPAAAPAAPPTPLADTATAPPILSA